MERGGYDPTDVESIVEYAGRLRGRTLREMTDRGSIEDPKRRRGSFGNAVENDYFMYDSNPDSRPDFAEVGLELSLLARAASAHRASSMWWKWAADIAGSFLTSSASSRASRAGSALQ